MKLKTFFAASIPEAMSEIRQIFGENAVIISSYRTKDKGVKLIVATEENEKSAPGLIHEEMRKNEQRRTYFQKILAHRQVSGEFIERLVGALVHKSAKTAEEKLLPRALSELYAYKSIEPLKKNGLLVFVGTAGCGKTTAIAKIAWHAKTLKTKTALISLDTRKPAHELARYADLLNASYTTLSDWQKLNETVTMLRLNYDLILIDTPAFNPYDKADIDRLKTIKIQVADADLIYVQAAGADCHEAQTRGAVFARYGCTQVLVSQIDLATSYGGFLQSAVFSAYQLAGFMRSAKITDFIEPATPENLAALLKTGKTEGDDE